MSFISDTEILGVLRGFNPWWFTGEVSEDQAKRVRRIAYYETRNLMEKTRRAILLSGARRVGKTTILYQLMREALAKKTFAAHQVLYVSFDHPILKLASLDKILDVFEQNVSGGSKEALIALDEIHYASEWNTWLKLIVDQNPGYRILATGSASTVLEKDGAESGVGRWLTVRIPTLSFYEYVEIRHIPAPRLPDKLKLTQLPVLPPREAHGYLTHCLPLQDHFHRYLLHGGFPETALLDDLDLAHRILRDDVVDKVLRRDMTALYGVRNVLDVERLFIFLCLHSGQIIVQEVLSREMGVTRATVANDLHFLELANLIYRSNPIEIGGKKALKPKPKIYLADPALRNAVLLKGQEVLADPDEMGTIVETTVFKHLYSFYYPERPRVGYWRDARTQKEVDVVLALPSGKYIAAEVKYREEPSISGKEGIVEFAQTHEMAAALVITKHARDFGPLPFTNAQGSAPFQVPAFAFLYLLGHAERHRW